MTGTEKTKSGTEKFGAGKSEMTVFEMTKSEIVKTETEESETKKSETKKSETKKSETVKTENSGKKKYKKGFTVGTFDMFHIGHLNLLRQAKEYCEYLIVGVHSDEWALQCKKKLPVIPYRDRAEIVRALRCVDEVVPNGTQSKLEAWEKYGFQAAFIGDDWKDSPVWNRIEAELKTVGCDVVYIPYTQGVSTTGLREKLRGDL